MIKTFFMLLFIGFILNIHSQDKALFKDGAILSIKAGYHSSDIQGVVPFPYDYSIPGGFCIDATAEIPTGKSWYLALNYDISYGKDERYDLYYSYPVNRTFAIYSFSPLVKYRIIANAMSFNLGAGLGVTMLERKNASYKDKDGMVNFNLRAGYDYAIKGGLLLSTEIVYYGMSQITFHGSGRNNNLFQLKAGIGYIFENKKHK